MTYTTDTSIAGPSRGSAAAWFDWARRAGAARPDDVREYLDTVYELAPEAGLRAELVVTQSIHETSTGEGPWTSYWWETRCNPAGIGITGDPRQNAASKTFPDGRSAALAQLVHMALYVFGSLPAALAPHRDEDPRADAIPRDALGRRTTIGSFGSDGGVITWAVDPAYGSKWAGHLNRLESVFAGGTGGNGGRPPMGYKAHTFPGFPKNPVWLPDDIPVEIRIIPSSVPGWTSGQKLTGQTKTTWHDTGNPSSTASSEWGWANRGGRADIDSPGSYNGIFDPTRIIISQRFDELVGHAGTPNGNRQSWAFEQAFGNGFDGGLRVGAALHGGIIAAMGWSADTALVQHNYWSGKWCPGQIRNRGIWSRVVAMVSDAALAASRAAGGGVVPPDAPIYAAPVSIPELAGFRGKPDTEIPYRIDGNGWVALYVGDRVKAIRDTPRRRYSAGDELVGAPVKAGEEFDVDWLLISTDFPDTYLTPWLTRVTAADTVRVSDVKQAA